MKKVSNKRFYGKWLYKTTLDVPGIGILRSHPIDKVSYFLNNHSENIHNTRSTHYKAKINSKNIEKICNFLKDLQDSAWGKRIEYNSLDIYTNDFKIYNDICQMFDDLLIHQFEPNKELINIPEHQNTIIANKLPHNKYRYKVFLTPHRIKIKDNKIKFLNWVDLQSDKILITDIVKKWFIDTQWNWDRRYMLVDNEQTLLMLKMRGADAIGKVYEYVIVDK